MKKIPTTILQKQFHEAFEKLTAFDGLSFEINHFKNLLFRAREAKNTAWEKEIKDKLKSLQERDGKRKKLQGEYRRLKGELAMHTDPKDPNFHGPVYEEAVQ